MKCSKCGLAVIVIEGKLVPACKCNAPVAADMTATAKGTGGVKVDKR